MVDVKRAILCKICSSKELVGAGSDWRTENGKRTLFQKWLCKNCGTISAKVKDENGELYLIPYEKKK